MKHIDIVKQRGLSLIELMIAITLALILTVVVALIYLSNSQTNRVQDENSLLQENGRMALEMLGRHFRETGYFDISGTNLLKDYTDAPLRIGGAEVPAVMGCEGASFSGGLTLPWSCAASAPDTPDSITITYQAQRLTIPADPSGSLPIGISGSEGVDCLGQGTVGGSPSSVLAINRYSVNSAKQLICLGNGNTTTQVLLEGIEDLQIRYGYGDNDDDQTAQYVDANFAGLNWQSVRSVEACVLVVSSTEIATDTQRYTNCAGQTANAADRRKRQAFKAIYTIRSRVKPMPTYPAQA